MRTEAKSSGLFEITKVSAKDFSKDQCGLRAAALSYYTAFALPPLLILLIKLSGLIWDPQAVQHALESQFGGLIGSGGAHTVSEMVASGQRAGHGVITTILGFAGLILGATGAFLSLQQALNAVWEVGPDPKQGGIKTLITERILSFGMLLGVALLLVVSLAVSSLATALGGAGIVMEIVNIVVSLAILTVLFAAIFKFLPDAAVEWRSVWVGGVATAVLFEAGKFVIGFYLGHSKPGNAFGAAGAFAVILVWLYYAGILVLFGAEVTQHFAQARGHGLRPKHGAVRIEYDERIVREDEPAARATARDNAAQRNEREGGRAMQSERHSIGHLVRQLSDDSTRLVQQEIHLAKTELRESAATAAGATAKLGLAAGLALPGLMALVAALVIGVGILIHSYWLSALIVGVVVVAIAAVLVKRAMAAVKSGLAPDDTVETVKEDASWAKHEVARAKRELSA